MFVSFVSLSSACSFADNVVSGLRQDELGSDEKKPVAAGGGLYFGKRICYGSIPTFWGMNTTVLL